MDIFGNSNIEEKKKEKSMKISLVITHYNEPWDVVKPMFDSISMQLGIDFNDLEVILVEDGEPLNDEVFTIYPFKTTIINQGHNGVSEARNIGLDHVTGEYVMFCDCDDEFISLFALHLYIKSAKTNKFAIIKSPFIENQTIDGELKLIRHDQDITFIHGKFYNVEFLRENELRFNPELTIHEDGFFNVLANMLADGNIHEMSPAVYLWKYRDESIVRKDRDAFIFKTYTNLMDCRKAICRELERRERFPEMFQAISKTVVDSYYDFQRPDALKPENKEIIEKAEKAFADFYNEFKEAYKNVNINDLAQMMYICRVNAYANGMRVEQETLSQFLTRIVKNYS